MFIFRLASTVLLAIAMAFYALSGLLLARSITIFAPGLHDPWGLVAGFSRYADALILVSASGLGIESSRLSGQALLVCGLAAAVAVVILRWLAEFLSRTAHRRAADAVLAAARRAPPPPVPEPVATPAIEATAFLPRNPVPVSSTDATRVLDHPAAPGSQAQARTLGRYELTGELGRGAMGIVYRAKDPRIGRDVAIKSVALRGLLPEEADLYRTRFLVEAKAVGALSHPGIVAVYDFLEDSLGQPCLVLELVEGTTLEKHARHAALPLDEALRIGAEVARALHYAHERGIVHRDVKPANIMLAKDGAAKVSDFGIAKMDGTSLTMAGQIIGTPAYMSPEQVLGRPVDRRSDVFSLGAVLYWIVSGERAFPGTTAESIADQVLHQAPAPLRALDAGLPEALERALTRCLEKDPAQRYATAAALADDLDALKLASARAHAQQH